MIYTVIGVGVKWFHERVWATIPESGSNSRYGFGFDLCILVHLFLHMNSSRDSDSNYLMHKLSRPQIRLDVRSCLDSSGSRRTLPERRLFP